MWPPKYIHLSGIEMEGGWDSPPNILKGDGSVSVIAPYVGEVDPGPYVPSKMPNYIKKYYPDHVNESCGYHIHISTKRADTYSVLTRDTYNEMFLDTMTGFARQVEDERDRTRLNRRLAGRNTYCGRRFIPFQQLAREGDRYTQLNFCAYQRHKTLECRLFPMFRDMATAIEGFKLFTSMTDDYIRSNIKSEREPVIIDENIETTNEELLLVA